MNKAIWLLCLLVLALAAVSVILLFDNHRLNSELQMALEQPAYLAHNAEGQTADLRGAYTYPGMGRHFYIVDTTGRDAQPTLTMAIFLSARTDCPAVLRELDVFKRLRDSFNLRSQQMVAVVEQPDSVRISILLDSAGLHLPISSLQSGAGLSLYQMGISYAFMPFKVLYDRHNTAIFARGSDNTPESQAEFERAVLNLSKLTAEGLL